MGGAGEGCSADRRCLWWRGGRSGHVSLTSLPRVFQAPLPNNNVPMVSPLPHMPSSLMYTLNPTPHTPEQFASLAVVTLPLTLPFILDLQAAAAAAGLEGLRGMEAIRRSRQLMRRIR